MNHRTDARIGRRSSRWVGCLALAALAGCGGGRNPDLEAAEGAPNSQRVGSLKAEVLLGGDGLAFRDGGVEGRGTVRFADVLPSWDSAQNFSVRVALEEGDTITLVANANRALQSGIEVEISRPIGASSPSVTVKAGADRLDATSSFTSVDASREFGLSFDLHNNEASLHVVAWRDGVAAPVLEDVVRGRGRGAFWGARLDGGRLRAAARSAPRDPH